MLEPLCLMSFATVTGRQIEYRMISGDPVRPTLVFLHEGLGSVALWRDFPDKAAARLSARATLYSRFGYGRSDGLSGKRTLGFMHEEALDVLPPLLEQLGVERPMLVGHSDGASIALIYAAAAQRTCRRPRPDGAARVRRARHGGQHRPHPRDLSNDRPQGAVGEISRQRRRRFLGWADTWLEPQFLSWSIEDLLPRVDQPVLLIQGRDDEYGTLAQVDRIEAGVTGPCSRLVLDGCGHAPQRDQEAAVLAAIVALAEQQRGP